jgi:hypothetical protein
MTSDPVPSVNATESHQSLPARALAVFVAPRRLFSSLGDDAPWMGVLLLATALAAIAVVAEPPEFFLSQMEDPVNRRGAPVEITSSPESIVLYGRMMAVLSAFAGHPMVAFAVAGLLSLVFSLIGRGQTPYRQYLVVVSHALLIPSIGMLVAVLLRAFTGDAEALPTIGGLIPGLSGSDWASRVLDGINLFSLWMLAVLAIGVHTLESRFTRARATTLLWGGYGALVVTTTLLFRA